MGERLGRPLIVDPRGPAAVSTPGRKTMKLRALRETSGRLVICSVVIVDDTVNTPQTREAGRLICEIAIAPATPMEFIHFRVGLSADGTVEFIEP